MTAAPFALRSLSEADLEAASALLTEALVHDRVGLVVREKIFGPDGARTGRAVGAFGPDGALLGVLAQAGRWIKLLAVAPAARGQGLGTALLRDAREHLGQAGRLRIADHPGNYLSPGIDGRYEAAGAFLRARGFREIAQVQNLRAPLEDNPLVTEARAEALRATARQRGYELRRVEPGAPGEVQALLAMASAAFSPVWAFELDRAIQGSGGEGGGHLSGVHAAFTAAGEPVAFAAHDGNNQGLGWFGPMGTVPGHRGQGLGEALLIPCLLDVRDRPEGGVIAWVGPVDFYHRACGAVLDRQFLVFEEG